MQTDVKVSKKDVATYYKNAMAEADGLRIRSQRVGVTIWEQEMEYLIKELSKDAEGLTDSLYLKGTEISGKASLAFMKCVKATRKALEDCRRVVENREEVEGIR